MNRTLSFLFAAALGATLGAFTALEIAPLLDFSHGLAATIGVIVGGLTGYIAVDFRKFCGGVVHAAHEVYVIPGGVFRTWWNIPLQFKLNGLRISVACFMIMLYLLIPDSVRNIENGTFSFMIDQLLFLVVAFAIVSLFFGVFVSFAKDENLNGKTLLYWASPIGIVHLVILKAPPWLAVGLYKIVRWFVRQTAAFGKTLFITVHSERRVLCSLDAMLGTLVGYYAGSWPAGTVAGLAFALVSYELISKRWLKQQPA